MSTQRRSEPHPFVSYADASHICKHCDGGEFAACHQANTIRQQSRAVRNMPSLNACTSCGLSYYQTSAPHVCAGWTTKENRTMNESEKFITTGVFRHERNTSGNCSISGCPCRGWSAQESVNEHEHEPVARGGEGEHSPLPWELHAEVGRYPYLVRSAEGVTVAAIYLDDPLVMEREEAEANAQLVFEAVNQHHSLLAEREKLREAATKALAAFRYMRDVDTQWWDFHVTPEICTAWDKLRAALNDQKGE